MSHFLEKIALKLPLLSHFKADRFAKVMRFLGPQVTRSLIWSCLSGIILFATEASLAFLFQSFLLVLGIAKIESVELPKWMPELNLNLVLALLVTFSIFRALLQWLQSYLQNYAYEKFRHQSRLRILKWVFENSSVSSGRVINLFSDRVSASGGIVLALQTVVTQGTIALLIGLTLLKLAPVLTIVSGLFLLLMAPFARTLSKNIKSAGKGLNDEWSKTYIRLLMDIKNLLLIRIYGQEKNEEEELNKGMDSFLRHSLVFHKNNGLFSAAPQVFGIIIVCLITLFAQKTTNQAPALLLTYFYLFMRLVQNLASLSSVGALFVFYWPQLTDLAKWWADHSTDGVRNRKSLADQKSTDGIHVQSPIGWKLQKIDYQYPDTHAPVFSNLNLDIAPGSALVITGPSGVGKSTLLNILFGELKPNAGEVRAVLNSNDYPIQEVQNSLLRNLGYVGPESFLIEGTIFENLIYGLNEKPSEEAIASAIQDSECQFVYEFQNKLEHYITEQGQGLSAGQKQRLSLARALLRNPHALILDEATANLDNETETRLVNTLMRLKGKFTLIAVTHRSELKRLADQCINLEKNPSP